MTAILLAASVSKQTVTIAYDNAGAFCDPDGYALPLDVAILP